MNLLLSPIHDIIWRKLFFVSNMFDCAFTLTIWWQVREWAVKLFKGEYLELSGLSFVKHVSHGSSHTPPLGEWCDFHYLRGHRPEAGRAGERGGAAWRGWRYETIEIVPSVPTAVVEQLLIAQSAAVQFGRKNNLPINIFRSEPTTAGRWPGGPEGVALRSCGGGFSHVFFPRYRELLRARGSCLSAGHEGFSKEWASPFIYSFLRCGNRHACASNYWVECASDEDQSKRICSLLIWCCFESGPSLGSTVTTSPTHSFQKTPEFDSSP